MRPIHLITTCLLLVLLSTAAPAATVPVDQGSAHEQASCKRCHFGTSGGVGKVPNARCTACHGGAGALRGTMVRSRALAAPATAFHRDTGRACVDCHSFHDPARVLTAAGTLDLAGARAADPAHCAACHGTGLDRSRLNPAHVDAAALYHAKAAELADRSPSTGCLNCHARRSESAWRTATEADALTFLTHASHPIGMAVVPGAGPAGNRLRPELDPRIPLFAGRMECQSCHALTAGTEDLLLPFASPKDLCLGCHRIGPPRPAPAPAADEPDLAALSD